MDKFLVQCVAHGAATREESWTRPVPDFPSIPPPHHGSVWRKKIRTIYKAFECPELDNTRTAQQASIHAKKNAEQEAANRQEKQQRIEEGKQKKAVSNKKREQAAIDTPST